MIEALPTFHTDRYTIFALYADLNLHPIWLMPLWKSLWCPRRESNPKSGAVYPMAAFVSSHTKTNRSYTATAPLYAYPDVDTLTAMSSSAMHATCPNLVAAFPYPVWNIQPNIYKKKHTHTHIKQVKSASINACVTPANVISILTKRMMQILSAKCRLSNFRNRNSRIFEFSKIRKKNYWCKNYDN